MTNIAITVGNLHGLRMAHADLQRQLGEARAKFEADNAPLIAAVKRVGEDVVKGEGEVREAALRIFLGTGERKPTPGVEVKDFTEVSYDESRALEWAKKHSIALSLDTKAFEALAKAGGVERELVTITKVPKATIATDLGKALEGSK